MLFPAASHCEPLRTKSLHSMLQRFCTSSSEYVEPRSSFVKLYSGTPAVASAHECRFIQGSGRREVSEFMPASGSSPWPAWPNSHGVSLGTVHPSPNFIRCRGGSCASQGDRITIAGQSVSSPEPHIEMWSDSLTSTSALQEVRDA